MVVIATKTNIHETIADDHPREIAPTPTRAVRAAQAITTEVVHHSTMTKRNIKISQQHLTSRSTTEIHQIHAIQLKRRTTVVKNRKTTKPIKRKDKIIKP
jgi:hypothetical protein